MVGLILPGVPPLLPSLSNPSVLETSSGTPFLLHEAFLDVPTRHRPSWALHWIPGVGLSASKPFPLTLTSLRVTTTATWGSRL